MRLDHTRYSVPKSVPDLVENRRALLILGRIVEKCSDYLVLGASGKQIALSVAPHFFAER
jgi:hypothetical protein